jgi:hypothetical protein
MLWRAVRIATNLLLGTVIFLCLRVGIASADRLGNEDLLFSHAGEVDHLLFNGLGQLSDLSSGLNTPAKNTLYIQDLKTNAKSKVFEVMNGTLGYSAIAPSGTMIAVQVNYQANARLNPKLLVLTADGKELTAFANSHDFTWSPDSRFLAYTTGISDQGEVLSTGTWVYDLKLKSNRKIFDKGDFVAWSRADRKLYIWAFSNGDRRILSFDPSNETPVQTNLRGIFFSPTGRYYHTAIPRYGEGLPEVHDAQSNQPILLHRSKIAKIVSQSRIVGWASEGDVLILELPNQGPTNEQHPQGRIDTVLYDVANDLARVIQDDSVIGWQNGQAVVHGRGKFFKRSLSSLPLLPTKQ